MSSERAGPPASERAAAVDLGRRARRLEHRGRRAKTQTWLATAPSSAPSGATSLPSRTSSARASAAACARASDVALVDEPLPEQDENAATATTSASATAPTTASSSRVRTPSRGSRHRSE